jgi:Tfp pilus assembly protein PilX
VRLLTGSQEGVALPVATAMLLVISLFVIAFFSVTLQVNDTSVDDRSSKRALAAAEAGLQMALYRMNQGDTPEPTMCFTTGWVPLEQTGQCPGQTDQLGNGASYTSHVTGVTPGACAGTTAGGTDRCITSVGRAGGLQRRVQVLANTLTGATSYKSVGLMSRSLMYGGNSSKVTSDIGSNGLVHWGNSAETFANSSAGIAGAVYHAPGSTWQTSGSPKTPAGGRHPVTASYEFPPIEDFDTVKLTAKNIVSTVFPREDMTYTANKTLRVTGSEAHLDAGVYYFCGFSMASSAKLTFSHTQSTEIYIDSPSREGSLCGSPPVSNPSPTYPVGTFWIENSNEFNKDGREDLVEIFVEGTSYNGTRSRPSFCTPAGDPPDTDKCESDVILANSALFEGMIYAPKTTVELNNSVKMKGAIGSDKIRFNNSVEFELTEAVKDSVPVTAGGIDGANWIECRPEPHTAGNPQSGC